MHDRAGSFSKATSLKLVLTRRTLVNLKRKAIRRGVWFVSLSRMERSCIDITIKVVMRVRSCRLARVLIPIAEKLFEAMETQLGQSLWQVGYKAALKISRLAHAWGNSSAIQWPSDQRFVRYLTIIRVNALEMRRI